jgi:hypothetical protein
MKKSIIATLTIVAGIGLAAPAQAAPCAYFGDKPSNAICGVPNVSDSIANARKNLQNNFSTSNALTNLGYAITHGVGSDDTQ